MGVARRLTTDRDLLEVTFTVPAEIVDGEAVSVVGEFNNWDTMANRLTGGGNGLTATILVRQGRRYRFRYCTDGGEWFNDEAADDYESNEFGGVDGVLDATIVVR